MPKLLEYVVAKYLIKGWSGNVTLNIVDGKVLKLKTEQYVTEKDAL